MKTIYDVQVRMSDMKFDLIESDDAYGELYMMVRHRKINDKEFRELAQFLAMEGVSFNG